jgi:AraC family transcriptional regulator of adaptative response / methylphosphotriester-DNA alkyltransferase methyltransferase
MGEFYSMPLQRPTTTRLRRSLFEEAVAIVEQEYADDLALDDIARRVATSRRQLQRAYSEIGDTTFREHLTAVRMDRAGELLRHQSLTIREVAHRVGYRQPAQFAKAFRRRHGAAPSGFRAHPPAEQRFSRVEEGRTAASPAS